jgi:hypothetical protein
MRGHGPSESTVLKSTLSLNTFYIARECERTCSHELVSLPVVFVQLLPQCLKIEGCIAGGPGCGDDMVSAGLRENWWDAIVSVVNRANQRADETR